MLNDREFHGSLHDLMLIDTRVDGAESLLTGVFDKVMQVGKYAGERTVVALDGAVKGATSGLVKTLGTRRMFIAHTHNRLNKEMLKDEMVFTSTLLKKVTRNGNPSDIIDGLDDLQKTMDMLKSYLQEVETYYNRELSLLKDVENIKTTEDAVSVVNGLDNLKFPVMRLPHHAGRSSISLDLPGGKTVHFNEDNHKLSLVNIDSPGEESTESFAKDDVKSILTKLNKLVESYQFVVKALNHYNDYAKKFNTVVGKSFAQLDSLKGTLSASILADLRSRLEGNAEVFAIYSGFLPKVMIYLDDYVDTLSSYLSKQFN